jgi:hypothetical protein
MSGSKLRDRKRRPSVRQLIQRIVRKILRGRPLDGTTDRRPNGNQPRIPNLPLLKNRERPVRITCGPSPASELDDKVPNAIGEHVETKVVFSSDFWFNVPSLEDSPSTTFESAKPHENARRNRKPLAETVSLFLRKNGRTTATTDKLSNGSRFKRKYPNRDKTIK